MSDLLFWCYRRHSFFFRLNKIGVTTLEALSMMTTKQVEFDLVGNDMDVYSMLLKAIRAAGTANPDVKMLTYYNEVQDHSFGFKLFIISKCK